MIAPLPIRTPGITVARYPNQTSLPTDGVAPSGQAGDEIEVLGPGAAHDGEGERRGAVHAVIGAVHDEPHALAQRAELPDDQLLRPVVVQHVAGLERGRVVRVVVVGELADLDQRRGDQRLEQHHARLVGHWMQHARIGGNVWHHDSCPASDRQPSAYPAGPSPLSTITHRSTSRKPDRRRYRRSTIPSQVSHPSFPLLGRAQECASIDRLLEGLRCGQSGSLVVRGEAGMGKTALLAYAVEQASDMTVLTVPASKGNPTSPLAGCMAC